MIYLGAICELFSGLVVVIVVFYLYLLEFLRVELLEDVLLLDILWHRTSVSWSTSSNV
jgi:hypothetical protein